MAYRTTIRFESKREYKETEKAARLSDLSLNKFMRVHLKAAVEKVLEFERNKQEQQQET